jgi:hypothetical protein
MMLPLRRHLEDYELRRPVGECAMQKAPVAFVTTVAVRIAKKTWRLARIMFDSYSPELHNYRPELHYMRGPGPKWREKHERLPHSADLGDIDLSRLNAGG